jgi:hypothetical protein
MACTFAVLSESAARTNDARTEVMLPHAVDQTRAVSGLSALAIHFASWMRRSSVGNGRYQSESRAASAVSLLIGLEKPGSTILSGWLQLSRASTRVGTMSGALVRRRPWCCWSPRAIFHIFGFREDPLATQFEF